MSTETVSFTVTGEFIYQTARRLYWLEDDHDRAYGILECLTEGDDGLTLQQTRALLDGNAVLDGDSNDGIEFAWAEDADFKSEIQEAKDHRARVKKEREAEAREERERVDPSDEYEYEEDEEPPSFLATIEGKPETPEAQTLRERIVEQWNGPPELGGLLREYGKTVRTQRAGVRGASQGLQLSTADLTLLMTKDEERQELHEKIFNVLGFTHLGKRGLESYYDSPKGLELAQQLTDFLEACYRESL